MTRAKGSFDFVRIDWLAGTALTVDRCQEGWALIFGLWLNDACMSVTVREEQQSMSEQTASDCEMANAGPQNLYVSFLHSEAA